MIGDQEASGLRTSPGGFEFGLQGWNWGEQRPKSITFFIDGTAKVSDQHGRPIRGAVINGKEVVFAKAPPNNDETPEDRKGLATHAQVVAALEEEQIDWKKLTFAGWPQLPLDELKKAPNLPPTPIEELEKIRDPKLREAAIKFREGK